MKIKSCRWKETPHFFHEIITHGRAREFWLFVYDMNKKKTQKKVSWHVF